MTKGLTKLNNSKGKDFDPTQPLSVAAFLDFNSLYGEGLSEDLIVGEIYEMTPEEIEGFDLKNVNCSGENTYILSIDAQVSPDAARKTDDLPLLLHHKAVAIDDMSPFTKNLLETSPHLKNIKRPERKLIASHLPQTDYLIAMEFLQVLLRQGLEVTKIHKKFRIKQKFMFPKIYF